MMDEYVNQKPLQDKVQPYRYNNMPPSREWIFAKHDALFAWLCLPLGFLFTRYVLCNVDGFATTGFFLLMLFGCIGYIRKSGGKLNGSHRLFGCLLAVFSLVFSISASSILHGLTFIFLALGIPWFTRSALNNRPFVSKFFLMDALESLFSGISKEYPAAFKSMKAASQNSKAGNNIRIIAIGLLAAIPLTIIVGNLLISADDNIERLFKQLTLNISDDAATIIFELLITIPISAGLFAIFFAANDTEHFPTQKDIDYENKFSHLRKIPNLGLYVSVTPICLLYLLYIISQTTYFCSAFFGILPDSGMTYAQYARRGFFELCAIAVINLIVLLILMFCSNKSGKNRPLSLKIYGSLICLFTLFIITTAIAKMVLYINAYGLTQLRLFTAWFMVLLAVIFVVLLVRQFRELPTSKILVTGFVVLFGILCFSRPDALIASYNISRYENGTLRELDVRMLCSLSDDTYAVMLNHADTIAAAEKEKYFTEKLTGRYSDYKYDSLQTWNISSYFVKSKCHEWVDE